MNSKKILLAEHIIKNICALYGDKGREWILNFPLFLSRYETLWEFKTEHYFADAQFNVVLSVMQNSSIPAVFKCCVPNKEFKTEVFALQHFDGKGAVKLLKNNIDDGAMLLEKIAPGTSLEKIISIEEATQKAIIVCRQLHKPISEIFAFPTLSNWFEGLSRINKKYDGVTELFSKSLIDKAKSISDALLASQSKTVLLHGDLHYANVLCSADDVVFAIDPKGVLGEPEFEIPLPRVSALTSKKELRYRLDCFIEQSGFDKQRIYAWVFCKAVLAAWWTLEDAGKMGEMTERFLWVANNLF